MINKNRSSKASSKKAASKESTVRTSYSAKAKNTSVLSDKELKERSEIIAQRFHPDSVNYLNRVFGINLLSPEISKQDILNIASGRTTSPIVATVRPLVFEDGELKESAPITIVNSFRFNFPHDKTTYKPIAHDETNKVYVQSFPCYDLIAKAEPTEQVEQVEQKKAQKVLIDFSKAGKKAQKDLVKFSSAQMAALASVGIDKARLYGGRHNSLSVEQKNALKAGEKVQLSGTVRLTDGVNDNIYVNTNGYIMMQTRDNDDVKVAFTPQYPVQRTKDTILDIETVRTIGNVRLDMFEMKDGKPVINEAGLPVLNQGLSDVVRYGVSLEPVGGMSFESRFDNDTNAMVEGGISGKYLVYEVNGGLSVEKLVKVNDLDEKGEQIYFKGSDGKKLAKYHYEIAYPRVSKDGTIRIGSESYSFASEEDLNNYKRGRGGVVKGFTYTDYATRKSHTYDAFICYNPHLGGFPKVFSEEATKSIKMRQFQLESKKPAKVARAKAATKPTKKQNFGLGF